MGKSILTMMQSGHRNYIKGQLTPIGRHFAECGIEQLSLKIIAGVKHGQEMALEIAEEYLISSPV